MNENNKLVLQFQNHYDMYYHYYIEEMNAKGAISKETQDLILNEEDPFNVLVSIPNDKHDLSHGFWEYLNMRYSKEYIDLVYPNHTKPYEDRKADDRFVGFHLGKKDDDFNWMLMRAMVIDRGGIIVEDHEDHSFFLIKKDTDLGKTLERMKDKG